MLLIHQILVRAFALGASALLIACGQQGPLYLPEAGNTPTTQQPANAASAPQAQ